MAYLNHMALLLYSYVIHCIDKDSRCHSFHKIEQIVLDTGNRFVAAILDLLCQEDVFCKPSLFGNKFALLWQEDVFCIPAIIIDDVVQARSGGVIHQTMRRGK